MKAVVLLAGNGRRLKPYTKVCNKSLIPFGGKPLLYYTLTNLLSMNIKDVCFVLGYWARPVRQYIDANFPSIRKTYIFNKLHSSTNSLYSYFLAADYFEDQDFVRLDGDILFPKTILTRLQASNYPLVTPVQKIHKKLSPDYTVTVDKTKHRILHLGKNIKSEQSFGIAMAIEFVKAEASVNIAHSLQKLVEKGAVNEVAEYVYEHLLDPSLYYNYILLRPSERWCDIDNLFDYHLAQQIFKSYATIKK